MSVSQLDFHQIMARIYHEETNTLKIRSEAVISGTQEVVISHSDDSIKIGDGSDYLAVNADGSINTVTSLAPTGIITDEYNEIAVTYPNATTEVYTYKFNSVTEFVITVTYTDSTKEFVSSVVKS